MSPLHLTNYDGFANKDWCEGEVWNAAFGHVQECRGAGGGEREREGSMEEEFQVIRRYLSAEPVSPLFQ